ncbi:glycosyltransferase family 1 protein [Neokomagataea tanensis]|uniref:Glycosyltransferase family 1 protein n=2 Tax=Neokomagataea TaxID=1223423 RepID=A0A4Y6V3U8_9PROT|nr:glycosyltransferase family 1 protein [Neokomagataea tanensis]QDH24623.1 glycosyltransferase family 1 protein [Neokomagataea tanensis]
MQITLDTRNTGRNNGTGITTYTNTLASALKELSGVQLNWLHEQSSPNPKLKKSLTFFSKYVRLVRAATNNRKKATFQNNDYFSDDIYRISHIHFKLFSRMMPVFSNVNTDIMHWTCPLPIYMPQAHNIYTIHDLIPIIHPEMGKTDPNKFKKLIDSILNNPSEIITVSESVKKDLIRYFGISPKRVHVVYQTTNIATQSLHSTLPDNDELADSFVYVGSIEKRKNIGRLIQAHAASQTKRRLVLIGKDGFDAQKELSALNKHPHPDRVVRLQWTPRNRLINIIRSSRAVVFPSLAEGFGLPIIEGMALGVPVLTSSQGATEEVAGQAALLIDPYSINSIADGIQQLDTNDNLCKELSLLGYRRANFFNHNEYGKTNYNIYNKL